MNTVSDMKRFEEKCFPVTESGCWLWDATPGSVYGLFWLNGKSEHAHRASWAMHCGPIPKDTWVLHKCDVKGCVNPDHLYLGSRQDNTLDAVTRGRMCRGESHRKARNYKYLRFNEVGTGVLTKENCLDIRQEAKTKRKPVIAKKYGVHVATIYRAINRADALLAELEQEQAK